MEFRVNHPLLYLMAGILVSVVLAQSVYFQFLDTKATPKPPNRAGSI